MNSDDEIVFPEQNFDETLANMPDVAAAFRKLIPSEAATVCDEIKRRFGCNKSRVWWTSMKDVVRCVDDSDTSITKELSLLEVQGIEVVFFIPDNDNGQPLPVYVCPGSLIDAVIRECYYWEYYVYLRYMRILIASTDHNQILVARADNDDLLQ